MLIVCERHEGEGTREEEKSISDTDRHRILAVGGKGRNERDESNIRFTHSGTPVAIFCVERVPDLDSLLMRNVLPGSLARFICAAVAEGKPFLRRCCHDRCRLLIGALFRSGLGHQCKS